MTITMPATGSSTHANGNHAKLLFIAAIIGCLCTFAIFTYSIDNLNALGLAPEVKKARTIEIIVFIFGEVFLSLAIGRVHKTHPEWVYKLAAVWFILLVIDFWGSYQARNAIALQQTLTQSAQKEHAGLIAGALKATNEASKELSDSSARQRANKMITGSAQSAIQAAKQADAGVALVDKHAAAIKDIRPTEADTFGEWNGTVIFLAVFSLYALNTAMWALIGDFSNGVIAAPIHNDSATSKPLAPTDSVMPKVKGIDLEGAKAAVKAAREMERMPKVPPISWKFAPLAVAPIAATGAHAMPVLPPIVPSDSATKPSDSVRKKTPRVHIEKPAMQFDTGTEGAASHRYQRVRKMVADKEVKPLVTHIAALDGEQLNAYRAKKYLEAMVKDGLLVNGRNGRFEYRAVTDPRQIELGYAH